MYYFTANIKLAHYNDVIMGAMASQITSLKIVYSSVYSGADERRHQSSASLAFVKGIHRWPVNSPHKGPVSGKMFPFDDVISQNTNPNEIHSSMLGNAIPDAMVWLKNWVSNRNVAQYITLDNTWKTISIDDFYGGSHMVKFINLYHMGVTRIVPNWQLVSFR